MFSNKLIIEALHHIVLKIINWLCTVDTAHYGPILLFMSYSLPASPVIVVVSVVVAVDVIVVVIVDVIVVVDVVVIVFVN